MLLSRLGGHWRSLETAPFDRSLYDLLLVELFHAEYYGDLEMWVRSHSRSLKWYHLKLGYGFLFAFHSNYGAILYRLRDRPIATSAISDFCFIFQIKLHAVTLRKNDGVTQQLSVIIVITIIIILSCCLHNTNRQKSIECMLFTYVGDVLATSQAKQAGSVAVSLED